MTKLTIRRRPLLASAASLLGAPAILNTTAHAAGRSIQIGIYGSNQGEFMRTHVLPQFEKDYNCRVFATEGVTLGQIAILRAQRSNPQYSVMLMDDVGIPIARHEGLIDPLPRDKMPNIAKLMPRFLFSDGYGAAFAISSGGLFYNPQATQPLASYADLWDKRFAQRFLMVSPQFTQSVFLLIAAAAVVTGKPLQQAQYLVQQAWPHMKALKPNVESIYTTFSSVMQVAQGDADVGGVEYSKNIYPYTLKGAPLQMCFPKEGTMAGVNCMALVKGAANPNLAAAFMNRLLEPSVQTGLAEATYTAPSIAGLTIKPDVLKLIAYPETKMQSMKLFAADWTYVNARRSAWIEQLNQIFFSA